MTYGKDYHIKLMEKRLLYNMFYLQIEQEVKMF